ncbi:hypothetical protein D3C77_34280 [compost metagenome]
MHARLVTWALCILLAVSGALYGLWQGAEAEAVRQVNADLIQANKSLRSRLVAVPAEIERQKEQRHAAEQAIEKDRVWADGPVPDPVRDGLCKRLRCR